MPNDVYYDDKNHNENNVFDQPPWAISAVRVSLGYVTRGFFFPSLFCLLASRNLGWCSSVPIGVEYEVAVPHL